MLMSTDPIDGAGSGTQDDPYRGNVEVNGISDMYVEVGTQLRISYYVGIAYTTISASSDDIGLEMTNSGGMVVGGGYEDAVIEGTVDSVGTLQVLFDSTLGTTYYYIHAVEPRVVLSFTSSPSDALITYVGATA